MPYLIIHVFHLKLSLFRASWASESSEGVLNRNWTTPWLETVGQGGGEQNKPIRQARTSCPSIRAKKFLEDLNTSNNKQKVIGNWMIL